MGQTIVLSQDLKFESLVINYNLSSTWEDVAPILVSSQPFVRMVKLVYCAFAMVRGTKTAVKDETI